MQYIKEMTVEIRITKDGDVYGCDLLNTDGELIFGFEPQFSNAKLAVESALAEIGLYD